MRIQDDGKSLRPAAQEKTGDHQRMEWLSWKRILAADVIPLSGWDIVESGCLAIL